MTVLANMGDLRRANHILTSSSFVAARLTALEPGPPPDRSTHAWNIRVSSAGQFRVCSS